MEPMMISPTSAASYRKRAAFTLIEMLVVIGIIVILAAVLLPMVMKALREGGRQRQAMDLQAISVGLEEYRNLFGAYPPVEDPQTPTSLTGSQVLCRALLAPGGAAIDGQDGFGFKIRRDATGNPVGKASGPFLHTEKFRLIRHPRIPADPLDPTGLGQAEIRDTWEKGEPNGTTILDPGRPVLYFPARVGSTNIRAMASSPVGPVPGFVGATNFSLFNVNNATNFDHSGNVLLSTDADPAAAGNRLTAPMLSLILGDFYTPPSNPPPNGIIDAGETPKSTGPYLLWTAGPDGVFFTLQANPTPEDVERLDDVTNAK